MDSSSSRRSNPISPRQSEVAVENAVEETVATVSEELHDPLSVLQEEATQERKVEGGEQQQQEFQVEAIVDFGEEEEMEEGDGGHFRSRFSRERPTREGDPQRHRDDRDRSPVHGRKRPGSPGG